MKSVIDASAFIHALTEDDETARLIRDSMGDDVFVPDHMRSECAAAIRGLHLGGRISARSRDESLAEIAAYPFHVVDFGMYYIASLMHFPNLTSYDAAYVAIADTIEAPLITLDSGMSTYARKVVTVIP